MDPSHTAGERVVDLLLRMTLEEKAGQMVQGFCPKLGTDGDSLNHIAAFGLGSLIGGFELFPPGSNPSVETWADHYDQAQSYALGTRLGIPLIYGVDAIHGFGYVFGAVVFPHNIGMGCTRNPLLVQRAEEITAIEVSATGIDWVLGPCLAVPQDERWGRTYEGFGETPEIVSLMALAAVQGFQGTDLSAPTTILACAKHYIGDGGTVYGTSYNGGIDQGNTIVDEAALRAIHLPGYISAVQGGVGAVMTSFSSWNGDKVHGSHYLITTVLKGELGFDGFVISDWMAVDQLPFETYKEKVEAAVNAGIDMFMAPENYDSCFYALVELTNEDKVSPERIDDAVGRILAAKISLGLFEHPFADRSLSSLVGCEEHREAARECVRQSCVLLKNGNGALPLAKNISRILVAGKNADDIGAQCGGWTMEWQGARGETTIGTTILQAVTNTVSASTQITYSIDAGGAENADAAIVVIGESPYAEGMGDRDDLTLDSDDIAAVLAAKAAGIPVVVVLISGRPMIITDVLDSCDAFVAAWLPGSEGQGVADVIFGDYVPTGKLSCTWPRDMPEIPVNYGDADYDPLFAYGFGLSF
jgi:beta-glucosidase